ncbi:Kiwa anti-phage protein KwaB-like domain-containing protein [Bacillus sp. DJP31]|uniref:Kiwa anti-phage protein KwaB-like domain-containing protein n=1 Tax=Bacillus sp. DJP31 TaxID=3409789 RepID=UPI003BB7AF7C
MNNIKIDSAEGKKFYTAEYNHELTKADYIAKLVIEDDEDLKDKLEKLFQSLNHNNSTFLDKDAKFQVVKISKDTDHTYFIFYRSVKISAMERRNVSKLPTVRDRDQLVIQDKNVIEFGGKIELFIHEDIMYILNPRTLEYTFNYDDHIKRQRDNNLDTITKMSFFDDESNTTKFKETSSQYILSRGLASI